MNTSVGTNSDLGWLVYMVENPLSRRKTLWPPLCGSSAPTSLFWAMIGSSPKKLIDSRLPKIPNGAPQDASRPGQMTEAGCHEPTRCAGSFVTAQSTMHWRHESRRPVKATTVKLVQTSTPRTGQSHAEPEKQRPWPVFRAALAAPVAETAETLFFQRRLTLQIRDSQEHGHTQQRRAPSQRRKTAVRQAALSCTLRKCGHVRTR